MRKTTTAELVRKLVGVAAIGGFAVLIFAANCGGSGGERVTGVGGAAGGTGAGGTVGCSSEQVLNCSAAYMLSDGVVTDFSPGQWSNTSGKFCDASGLRGSIYSYSGTAVDPDGGLASSHSQAVSSEGLVLTLTAAAGDYAGGGLSFDHCVNASAFNALQFTISIVSGDLTGCDWVTHLKTYEQQADSQTPPGGCASATTSCYDFPSAPGPVTLTGDPMTLTLPFSSFATASSNPPALQVVGVQWQILSASPIDPDGGAQIGCTVELRVDDIKFVNQ